jgi:molybdopterin-guanine dinucleotide biosynthesis protein B
MSPPLPAFGICGWSGAGKTTLLEALIPRLRARGLRVAAVKHDVHGIQLDVAGKDSDRLFRAGAAVALLAPQGIICRIPPSGPDSLTQLLLSLDAYYDVILCEGHKSLRYERKLWLRSRPGEEPPAHAAPIDCALDPGLDRVSIADRCIQQWLDARLRSLPLYAGVLIGGQSCRMGRPKHLLPAGGKTWIENTVQTLSPRVQRVVLLGAGSLPPALHSLTRLPDVVGKTGPLAGMLAAMRWQPDVAWLFVACDLPWLAAEAVDWLLAQRKPGVWAILPRSGLQQPAEPLFALYEPRSRLLLESVTAPAHLRNFDSVLCPQVPPALAASWKDVDTPAEAALLFPPASET